MKTSGSFFPVHLQLFQETDHSYVFIIYFVCMILRVHKIFEMEITVFYRLMVWSRVHGRMNWILCINR